MTWPKIASAPGAVGRVGLIRSRPFHGKRLRSVPRDGAIPHLAVALDAAVMRKLVQATVFADRSPTGVPADREMEWQVRGCAIEWIKYRPGRSCTVAYRVSVGHRSATTTSDSICVRDSSGTWTRSWR